MKLRDWLLLATVAVVFPEITQAASADLTFQSFFKADNTISWIFAASMGLLAGALILYSAGTATPVVSGIGTWIGGLMGYSGVAATNAGLAWLGGGSLAAGGYGMAGGAALLTAVLTFSTEVVVDATITNRHDAYSYAKFTALTQNMVTLPLPRNDNGPKSVEAAFKILKRIDEDANLRDPKIQIEIERAHAVLTRTHDDSITAAEAARKKTFSAILELILGRVKEARASADQARLIAEKEQIRWMTPAFLLAVAELHEDAPDIARADALLNYSVNGERDNPLTPLMVKMYADRLAARITDGSLAPQSAAGTIQLIAAQPDDKRSAMHYGGMAVQLLGAIKIEQQHLMLLLRTDNDTLLASPETADKAAAYLSNFRALLGLADQLLKDGGERVSKQLDGGRFSVTPTWAKLWAAQWLNFHNMLGGYQKQVPELIEELEMFKSRLAKPVTHAASEDNSGSSLVWTLLLLTIFLGAGFGAGVMYQRRQRVTAT